MFARAILRNRQTPRAHSVRPYIPLQNSIVGRGLDPSGQLCNYHNLTLLLAQIKTARRVRIPYPPGHPCVTAQPPGGVKTPPYKPTVNNRQPGAPQPPRPQNHNSSQPHTLKPAKHPGCLQLVAKFYKQLKITYLCNILNCFSSCRVLSTRGRKRWSTALQCRGPASARTKSRSCLCAPGGSCCFPAARRGLRFAWSTR